MKLPYLCHFRLVLHTWDSDQDEDGVCTYNKPMFEILHMEMWSNRFTFRSLKQKEKDDNDLSYLLKKCENPGSIQILPPDESDPTYLNEHTMQNEDYGKECLTDDIIDSIVESDLKNPKGERYFEVIGELHEHTSQDYWGEWDSETNIEDVRFQELCYKDVKKFCKHEGIQFREDR